MFERETMLPLTVGLVLSVTLHLLVAASYGWWSGDRTTGPPDPPAGPSPDLVAAAIRFDLAPVAQRAAPVALTVTNAGSRDADGFDYELLVDGQTHKRATVDQRLPAGASLELTAALHVTEPGLHVVQLVVDPRDRLREADETNNALAQDAVWLLPENPGPRMADLMIYRLNLPQRAKVGQRVPVELFIANLGDAEVDVADVELTLDGKPIKRLPVETETLPTFGRGEIVVSHATITVDESGVYEFCAEVDPDNRVPEADETNNRACAKLYIEKPRSDVGMAEPSVLSMNTISYEHFEALLATEKLWFDQPTVQMTTEPDPTAQREPVDPTPPALVSKPQLGASPSKPQPQTDISHTPAPAAGTAADQPDEIALAQEQDNPRDAVGRPPLPVDVSADVDVLDPTPALEPDNASPIDPTSSPTVVITDPAPPLPTDDQPDTVTPRPDTLLDDEVRRESPEAARADAPDLADATRPKPGPPGEQPVDATSEQADPEDHATQPTEPAESVDSESDQLTEPVEVAMTDAVEPREAAVEQPALMPSTASDANPTIAPRADAEAPAATRFEQSLIIPGRVWAKQGVRLKTVRPRFSPAARLTTYPFNPIVRIEFDGDGKVIRVHYVRSSGWDNIDAPLRIAIYKWTAEGNFDPNGFVIEKMLIVLNPTAKQAEEYEAQQEKPKTDEAPEESEDAKPASGEGSSPAEGENG